MIKRNSYTPHKGRAISLTSYRPYCKGLATYFPRGGYRSKFRNSDVRLRYMMRCIGVNYMLLRVNQIKP